MRAPQHVAAAYATLLLAFVIDSHLVRSVSPYTRFSNEAIAPTLTRIRANNVATPRFVAALTRGGDSASFGVECPSAMKINETVPITLRFNRTSVSIDLKTQERTDYQTSYPDGKGARLLSPAFEIKPEDKVTKSKDTPLPTSFTWLIKPRMEGAHELTLDISDLLYHGLAWEDAARQEQSTHKPQDEIHNLIKVGSDGGESLISNKLTVNGKEQSTKDIDSITIPVVVYTMWGISERTYQSLIWTVAVFAALAAYPLILRIADRLTLSKEQVMGDKIINTGAGATIVNRSTVEGAFNKVRSESGEATAQALKKIEEAITKAGNEDAAADFNAFNEELQKPQPHKAVLKTLWDGIVTALPKILEMTEVIASIKTLIGG